MKKKTVSLLGILALCGAALHAQDDPALARARRVLKRTPIIDGHNDLPWAIRTYEKAPRDVEAYDLRTHTPGATDLTRLREGGVGGQFWSVYIPAEGTAAFARTQLEQIDIARRIIARYPDALEPALTAAQVRQAMKRKRVASMLGIEGGQAIENSLGALRAYYDLGVRYMTLTHTTTLDWADAAGDPPRHDGLTRFGEEVVREMNRLGMLVDLSHVTPETMADAIRVSEAPVIFSHSSARALCNHVRDVPDDILKMLPRNGGVVMVTFVAAFVSEEVRAASEPLFQEFKARTKDIKSPEERQKLYKELAAKLPKIKVTIAQVADHVDHIRQVAGVDHVGLGGDYDGNDLWPEGMEDVSSYPKLFAELVRRGWSDADLGKLAQGNVLRVMEQAEGVARRLAKRPPSLATIEALDGPKPSAASAP